MENKLYLYKLTQDVNNGYDTFDSVIVAAENKEVAQYINPSGGWPKEGSFCTTWAYKPEEVKVQLIGIADPTIEKGIVLASFNAG